MKKQKSNISLKREGNKENDNCGTIGEGCPIHMLGLIIKIKS